MSEFPPTPQQHEILTAVKSGKSLAIQARAGTGKTTTCGMAAEVLDGKRGVYIAFNKAIANEAASAMPRNVKASTAHSLAFQAVGKSFSHRLRGGRVWPRQVAKTLGLSPKRLIVHGDEPRVLSDRNLARMVMDMVANFCRSADTEIGVHHFPLTEGLDAPNRFGGISRGPIHRMLGAELLPHARTVWADVTNPEGSRFQFSHDHYLKMYQLSNPRIAADFLLFDEAQDANPVIAAIVEAQTHLQVILVGDTAQAIYGFTGAVDAMSKFAERGMPVYPLSESFRFGPAVADVANVFLTALNSTPPITGFDKVPSRIGTLDAPGGEQSNAILCRTNAGCLAELIGALDQGRKASLVGGARDLENFVKAAQAVKRGEGTEHPDLCAFPSWADVEQYVQEEETSGDLATMVKMIQKHGVDRLLQVLASTSSEEDADVIISTAHKSKGRQWANVRIADFPLDSEKGVSEADLMLAYVAVTRAQLVLDLGTLSTWLHDNGYAPAVEADEDPLVTEAEGLDLLAREAREVEVAAPDTLAELAAEVAAEPVVVGTMRTRTIYVAVTEQGTPTGPEFTFEQSAQDYAKEKGLRYGSIEITMSPVTILAPVSV